MKKTELAKMLMELDRRIARFFDAQLKAFKVHLMEELDARVEQYFSSTETSMAPSAQAPSEKALDLVGSDISAGSDLSRSQSMSVRSMAKMAARRTPKEKISVASSDVVDSRSAPTKAARRTPMSEKTEMALDLRAQDRRRIFDRGRRWIFDRRRLWIFNSEGRHEVVTGGRSEAWSRRIAEIYRSSGVNEDPLLSIH
ncbi:hypothetical protein CsatB_007639 [Cannabis sativa]